MSDIFISYASEDRARAKVLAGALERQGWSVWWDRKIPPGRQFSQVIKEAIDEARCIIVLWSEESVKSDWVQNEASEGARRKILVPALIDDVEIPFEFRRIQAARLVDWEGRSSHPEFDILLEAVRAILGQPLLPKASEPAPVEQKPGLETEKAWGKSRMAKVIAAICIVGLIAVISTGVFLKYLQPKTYRLTATAGPNGSISPTVTTTVTYGGDMAFTAKPDEGYQVDTWSVDEEPVPEEGTTYTLSNIQSNHTVNVTFRRLKYEVTGTASPNGSISPSVTTTVNYGGDLPFTATPDEGYQIDSWSVDKKPVPEEGTTYTLSNIRSDHTVNVTFRRLEYQVTGTAGSNGSISPSAKTIVTYGGDLPFTAKPDNGYQIDTWSVDEKPVPEEGITYTLSNIRSNQTVKVTFRRLEYEVTGTAGSNGSISPSVTTTVNYGGDLSFTMTPEAGYQIDDVLVDGASVGAVARYTFKNVTADHTITASFVLLKVGNVVTNSIGMKLVYIPAGSFMMGSSSSAAQLAREYLTQEKFFTDELPQHQVRISEGFWMGQTEVTQGQYESVMNARPWLGKSGVQQSANNPAVYVSWDDATEFCRKLGQQEGETYRLPTEAEWEYACRAGTTTRFSFGDSDSSLGDYAWCRSNAYEVGQDYAHSVGQKKPNPWGLYDMHGNVWELCSDWYDEDYYSNSPSVDPKGSSSGATRSLRGGCCVSRWDYFLRCSHRPSGIDPADRGEIFGFRVVRSQ